MSPIQALALALAFTLVLKAPSQVFSRCRRPVAGHWKSTALRAYQRRTLAAAALIASSYLAGTTTRRIRRALAAVFGGPVGKER